jgi:hypothetical protein
MSNPELSEITKYNKLSYYNTKKVIPNKWRELHFRTLEHDGSDDSMWLSKYFESFPRSLIKQYLVPTSMECPPRWDDYFNWSIEFRNKVRLKLKAPMMDFQYTTKEHWENEYNKIEDGKIVLTD